MPRKEIVEDMQVMRRKPGVSSAAREQLMDEALKREYIVWKKGIECYKPFITQDSVRS
jgi:hypothetical protein